MSATIDTSSPAPEALDQLRAWLIQNPDFIREDAELFAILSAAPEREGVIDLGQAARNRLMTEIKQLKALNEGIVETARANLAIQSQVHMAVLALLEADSLATLDRKLANRIPGALSVDLTRVFVEDHAPLRDGESLKPCATGFVDRILGQNVERLGPIEGADGDALYAPQGQRMKSHALVRLDMGSHQGVLALAARDAHMFQAGQGTELLNFLARSLERLLVRWL